MQAQVTSVLFTVVLLVPGTGPVTYRQWSFDGEADKCIALRMIE